MGNRKILFRGLKADGSNEWVYGYYISDSKMVVTPHAIYSNGQFIEVIPSTVGQFCGLTDKNGTRIFEGDILILSHRTYWDDKFDEQARHNDVVYVKCNNLNDTKCYYLSNNELWDNGHFYDEYSDDWYEDKEYVKVIGNIHQN